MRENWIFVKIVPLLFGSQLFLYLCNRFRLLIHTPIITHTAMVRKIFFLTAILPLSLFLSCTRSGNSGNNMSERKMEYAAVKQADTLKEVMSVEEEFGRFIERFSKDEKFQLRRIKFPISVIVPDTRDQGMAPIEESIGKYDWEMLDLTYDSTYLTRPYDQYYQEVRFRNDTAVVEIRGINNGIYADYYFVRIDSEWYLVTLYEASF